MAVIVYLLGSLMFLLGFGLVLFLLSPIYAFASADAFERGEEWFIIFVRRRPNRLMQRIKGTKNQGKPLDFIGIIPPGTNFFGETVDGKAAGLTKEHPAYWKLVPDNTGSRASTGIMIHRSVLLRMWMAYINLFSDVALVGVRKLYSIYTYPIEKTRYEKKMLDGGTSVIYSVIPPRPPNDPERSNHVRIAPFQWVVAVVGVETHDRFSWNFLMVANVKSINPWQTLHNHENWSQFLTTAIVDSVVRGLKRLSVSQVLGLAQGDYGDEASDYIIKPVYAIEDRLRSVVGLEFDKSANLDEPGYSGAVQLLFVDPQFLTEADKAAFTQPWRADQEAAAEVTLGKAEANRESRVIMAVARMVNRYGAAGELVQRMQALENAGKAGNTILFDTNGQTSNLEKLLALQVDRLGGQPRDDRDDRGRRDRRGRQPERDRP